MNQRTEYGSHEDFHNRAVPFRIVLVMQGGGALGAYHCGVYQALHEGGLEPDWIIGTSIGAITGALIAGNKPERRLQQLRAFWDDIETVGPWDLLPPLLRSYFAKWGVITTGVPGFFVPNFAANLGWRTPVGIENASVYSIAPLKPTLAKHIDFDQLNSGTPHFSFGLVHVDSGKLHYFDNRKNKISLDHVLASGALPPSFPAVRINGEAYWDAGFYSNTPIEKVFDERAACNSIIFVPSLWVNAGGEPQSMEEVLNREKSIGFSSRLHDQVARQVQLHRLRHIIHQLIDMLPEEKRETLRERNFSGYESEPFMHLIQLNARGFEREGVFRDIDFTPSAIRERWKGGYADTRRMLDRRPWEQPVALINGVAVHNSDTNTSD
ncbi:MAG: patatin-like phospholipase family protein [Beijerinckiaceae bacterium]